MTAALNCAMVSSRPSIDFRKMVRWLTWILVTPTTPRARSRRRTHRKAPRAATVILSGFGVYLRNMALYKALCPLHQLLRTLAIDILHESEPTLFDSNRLLQAWFRTALALVSIFLQSLTLTYRTCRSHPLTMLIMNLPATQKTV